ncbi:holin [Butyrivibrio sp. CB08]|uniref:phage holin family protein n=1 Tax=Butyrivibrio sp. CB08 TaxID=2364879 RepID=UPI000EA8FBB4|nr:phage holin family protein [Butyrivibrio sp. CB08]RKM55408.1 holin [Butyrivibrio sp. CB08]
MKNVVTVGQYIFTGIGGVMGWIFGGLDGFLYALIAFVVIDYLTGVMAAIYTKQLSSEVGFKGIARKVAIFLLVGIGNVIDIEILKTGAILRNAVIFFYLSNEGVSIIENSAKLELPIPKKLVEVLKQIKDGDEDDKTSE